MAYINGKEVLFSANVNQDANNKPFINTAEITNFAYFFAGNGRNNLIEKTDLSRAKYISYIFSNCHGLTEEPLLPTHHIDSCMYIFEGCKGLKSIKKNKFSSTGNMTGAFQKCTGLEEVDVNITDKTYNFNGMFSGCTNLKTVKTLDMIKSLSQPSMFNSCTNLTELTLLNIKLNLQIGSADTWGHLLTLESLLNTIQELWNVGEERTLTVGSANLAKLANVYVKTVTITDEMRAADANIDLKVPFEVCESTDEGAMLITQYASLLKQWTIK